MTCYGLKTDSRRSVDVAQFLYSVFGCGLSTFIKVLLTLPASSGERLRNDTVSVRPSVRPSIRPID